MKTYIFLRDETIIGVITCPEGLAMTAEQTAKVDAAGIEIIRKDAKIPLHDGDMNRLVDLLIENDWL